MAPKTEVSSGFSNLNLSAPTLKALQGLGFISPTSIQEKVIPITQKGQDVIACAETGSGKTGAYVIPIVDDLVASPKKNALILAPTRELAQQIMDFVVQISKLHQGFNTALLVGGSDMRRQFMALKKHPRIIVATPGRLNDHLKRRTADLRNTQWLVLDEGDRMLDMGFSPQLDAILEYLPEERQSLLFSATLPDKVKKLADSYLDKPILIKSEKAHLPVATIDQKVLVISSAQKKEKIIDELNQRSGSVIIFVKTKQKTDELAEHLYEYGFSVDSIHGGRSQGQRNKAIDNLKKGRCRILCATDVAARGIDIPSVEHVINYDLPMMDEDYIHRIGRTGRNGASGNALSFVTPSEQSFWNRVVKKFKIPGVMIESRHGGGGSGGGRSQDRRSDRSAPRKSSYSSSGERGYKPRSSSYSAAGSSDYTSESGGSNPTYAKRKSSYSSDKSSEGSSSFGARKPYSKDKASEGSSSFGARKPYSKDKASEGSSSFGARKPYSKDAAKKSSGTGGGGGMFSKNKKHKNGTSQGRSLSKR